MLAKKLRERFADRQMDVHNDERTDDQRQMVIHKVGQTDES